MDNVTNRYFGFVLFVFIRVGFEGDYNIYAKKGIKSAMEFFDIAAFTFAAWGIRSCLLCKVVPSAATVF